MTRVRFRLPDGRTATLDRPPTLEPGRWADQWVERFAKEFGLQPRDIDVSVYEPERDEVWEASGGRS